MSIITSTFALLTLAFQTKKVEEEIPNHEAELVSLRRCVTELIIKKQELKADLELANTRISELLDEILALRREVHQISQQRANARDAQSNSLLYREALQNSQLIDQRMCTCIPNRSEMFAQIRNYGVIE